jgi:hypothetical protein
MQGNQHVIAVLVAIPDAQSFVDRIVSIDPLVGVDIMCSELGKTGRT